MKLADDEDFGDAAFGDAIFRARFWGLSFGERPHTPKNSKKINNKAVGI